MQELPGAIVDEPIVKETEGDRADENMDIAWRYQNLPKVQVDP